MRQTRTKLLQAQQMASAPCSTTGRFLHVTRRLVSAVGETGTLPVQFRGSLFGRQRPPTIMSTTTHKGPLSDLTAFKRDLLRTLATMEEDDQVEKLHGLAIKDELNAVYNTEVTPGRLYPNLDQLVGEDLVEKEAWDKRTNVYTLTSKGRRVLSAHVRWMEVVL